MNVFHEIRFPLDISLKSRGGPERRTRVTTLISGREERNAQWAHSRRKFDAGYGVHSLAALAQVVAFFEERRGMLYGFRFRDPGDYSSCTVGKAPTPNDQIIGQGDGTQKQFQLLKVYGAALAPYKRFIQKPVDASVRIALNGVELARNDFSVAYDRGLVTLRNAPLRGVMITAGFIFDVPVRFDTDYLEIDYSAFAAGEIPKIPLIEILL
jgi:uncharacterized protein (TIGR02217 family)